MKAIIHIMTGLMLTSTAGLVGGCDRTSGTNATPSNTGTGMTGAGSGYNVVSPNYAITPGAGAGGAPSFGASTGTGFHTGDPDQSGGTGSGLEGFHGLGSTGTSGAITDTSTPTDSEELGTARTVPHE